MWDEAGRRYIDMMGAYSAASFGHCHPRLVKALTEQAQRLDTISRAYFSDRLGPFLAKACALTGMDAALPMNSGAEAVETALKAARKWAYRSRGVPTDRAEIIVAEGFPRPHHLDRRLFFASPISRRLRAVPPGFTCVPFGDASALAAAITSDTAAFLVEPIQGEGGINVPPPGYLAEVARICKANNAAAVRRDPERSGTHRTSARVSA